MRPLAASGPAPDSGSAPGSGSAPDFGSGAGFGADSGSGSGPASDHSPAAAMVLHGVVNASPDSLAGFSVVSTVDEARHRAEALAEAGCAGIDLGGAGSTPGAARVGIDEEWRRLDGKIEAIAALGLDLSVDTWQPEIMRRALDCGATIMNASDGMQNPAMAELAAERGVPVILPFLPGPDPKAVALVPGDPVEAITAWFRRSIPALEAAGVDRSQLILDPGTGFGPDDWAWEDRYLYQKRVYANLDALRAFGRPIYLPLPWKQTPQHDELLEMCVRSGFDYGRCHDPARVQAAITRLRANR